MKSDGVVVFSPVPRTLGPVVSLRRLLRAPALRCRVLVLVRAPATFKAITFVRFEVSGFTFRV